MSSILQHFFNIFSAMHMRIVFLGVVALFLIGCSNPTSPGTPASDSLAVVNPPSWSAGRIEGTWIERDAWVDDLMVRENQHGMVYYSQEKWKAVDMKREGSEIWYEVKDPFFQGGDAVMRVRLTVYSDRLEGYALYNPGYGWWPLTKVRYVRR